MTIEKIKEKVLEIKMDNVGDEENTIYDELLDLIDETFEKIVNKKGRKSEVLEILRNNDFVTINEIAKQLNISNKNVSSQLSYLRADGFEICTNRNGKKFLLNK